VEVHQAPIGCGVWKDHVPTALSAGWVWCWRPSLLIGWRPVVASAVGKYSLGEMVLADIPLDPTFLEEQRAQCMSRARSGNGATHSRTQRRRSEYGEHGEYPPLDIASTLLVFH
jgi:hypothetical protein